MAYKLHAMISFYALSTTFEVQMVKKKKFNCCGSAIKQVKRILSLPIHRFVFKKTKKIIIKSEEVIQIQEHQKWWIQTGSCLIDTINSTNPKDSR